MAGFGRGGNQPDKISGVVPRSQYEKTVLAAQELDERRQAQIENQRMLLNMNQEKFTRLLQQIESESLDDSVRASLKATIQADRDEVKSWRV